jgi:hypothetical protein
MSDGTRIYGHSRGYRALTIVALVAFILSVTNLLEPREPGGVPIAGALGFGLLLVFSWSRASRRTVVLTIEEDGFCVCDPAIALGVLAFDEIAAIRIYATLERPMVGFAIQDPTLLRRRMPIVMRLLLVPLWWTRRYQVVVELDRFNDQIAAIKSTALKAGIPVISELV